MAMPATSFLAHYKDLKARLEAGEITPPLQEAFGKLTAAFKAAYSAETLKAALAERAMIPSELEERLTSALVLFNQERSLSGAHATISEEEET